MHFIFLKGPEQCYCWRLEFCHLYSSRGKEAWKVPAYLWMWKELLLRAKTMSVQGLNPTVASEETLQRYCCQTGGMKVLYSGINTVRIDTVSLCAHTTHPLVSPEILHFLRRDRESTNLISYQLLNDQWMITFKHIILGLDGTDWHRISALLEHCQTLGCHVLGNQDTNGYF